MKPWTVASVLVALSTAAVLGACGGGGGKTAATPTEPPTAAATTAPAATASGSTSAKPKFDQVGLVNRWSSSGEPDPKTFATSFQPGDAEIDAAVRLAAGAPGWVTATWKYQGDAIKYDSVQADGAAWTHLALSRGDTGAFPSGDYQVDLALAGTSETKSLKFSVGSAPSTKAKFDQAGIVKRYADSSPPDPSSFVTSIGSADTDTGAAFKLAPGADGWVTAEWRYRGQPMDTSPMILAVPVRAGKWGFVDIASGMSAVPSGDYEVGLALAGSGESRTLRFTATPASGSDMKVRFGDFGLTDTWDAKAAPDTKKFTTKFPASVANVYAVFNFASGNDGWVRATWKYQGVLVAAVTATVVPGRWMEMDIYRTNAKFAAGDYEAALSVLGGGETKSARFTISDSSPGASALASTSPTAQATSRATSTPSTTSKAKFDQTGMADHWAASKAPDTSTFAKTFSPTAAEIDAIFRLTDDGEVTATWKYQGDAVDVPGQTSLQVKKGQWGALFLKRSNAEFPKGDWEVTLKITGTSESKTLSFSVN